MADIGRSTSAHDREIHPGAHRTLRLWGDWIATLEEPSPGDVALSPMFREYVAGYRESGPTRGGVTARQVPACEFFDRQLAESITDHRVMAALVCGYVLRLSARKASEHLSRVAMASDNREDKQLRCSHETYRQRLIAGEQIATDIYFRDSLHARRLQAA